MLHEHIPVRLESSCFERDRIILSLRIEWRPNFCSRYESALKETRRIGIRKSFVQGMMIGLIMFFMFGTYALAFWWVRPNTGNSVSQSHSVAYIVCLFRWHQMSHHSRYDYFINSLNFYSSYFYWMKNPVFRSSVYHYIFQ